MARQEYPDDRTTYKWLDYWKAKAEIAQATADRLRELMLKQDKKIKVCQFCYRHLKWDGKKMKMIGHADDCEWGKELADE
jgi:hypothetical protein